MAAWEISPEHARRIAVEKALLDGRRNIPGGKDGVLQALDQLGYVQIDTISVVERAHHHALFSRVPGYRPPLLDQLQSHDRQVFEYWAHAMCYLPLADYRYTIPSLERHRLAEDGWVGRLKRENRHLLEGVLARIREEGPLSAKDFDKPLEHPVGAWWNWKPAKAVLEVLYWQGELMITGRKNFQRVYDLTERVLPGWVDTTPPSEAEVGRFLVNRALRAFGVASARDVREYMYNLTGPAVMSTLKDMVASKEIVEVRIGGAGKTRYYAAPHTLEATIESPGDQVKLLSPFDLLVIHRKRTQEFFNFDYTIECYTPKHKRIYGYFSLPILWGDRLVGRLDAKADRKAKVLLVQSLHLEPWFQDFDDLALRLGQAIREYAVFNGCRAVKLYGNVPGEIAPQLTDFLGNFPDQEATHDPVSD